MSWWMRLKSWWNPDVVPTKHQRLILRLLDDHGAARGLELVRFACGKLSRGTIYVELLRLEQAGLVHSYVHPDDEGDLPRYTYEITAQGRTVLYQSP